MDAESLRILANIDQTRSTLRDVLKGLSSEDLSKLIKEWAAGRFEESHHTLIGLLAINSVFDLLEIGK